MLWTGQAIDRGFQFGRCLRQGGLPVGGGGFVGPVGDMLQAEKGDLFLVGNQRQGVGFHVHHVVGRAGMFYLKVVAAAAGALQEAFCGQTILQHGRDGGERRLVQGHAQRRYVHVALDELGAAHDLALGKSRAAGGAEVDDEAGAVLCNGFHELIRRVELAQPGEEQVPPFEGSGGFFGHGEDEEGVLLQEDGEGGGHGVLK